MEFVVEHDLGATRAIILRGQGKYGEAVRQYLDEEQDQAPRSPLIRFLHCLKGPEAWTWITKIKRL